MCLDLRKLYNDTYAAQWEKDRLEHGSGDHAEAQTEAIDAIRAHFDEREKAYSFSIKTLSDALTGLGQKVTLDYTNHRGERAIRTVTPASVTFGSTKWHPEPGLMIQCYDHDKAAVRVYAWFGVHSWNGVEVRPSPGDPVRAALEAIRHRTYSNDRGCALDAQSVAEIADIASAALSVSTPTGEGEAGRAVISAALGVKYPPSDSELDRLSDAVEHYRSLLGAAPTSPSKNTVEKA